MMSEFILRPMRAPAAVPRRTIHLPDSAEQLVRDHIREGESFSAAVVRLIELGALNDELDTVLDEKEEFPLGYIGSSKGGPPDLAINAEKYLGLKPWGPGEKPWEGPGDEDPR